MKITLTVKCKTCTKRNIIKNGFTAKGKQRYRCLECGSSFLVQYDSQCRSKEIDSRIINHVKQGVGIRSISSLLEISPTTVVKKIKEIASKVKKPDFILMNQVYELDELCTYVNKKKNRVWVAYALNKKSKDVIDFVVGKRNNGTLRKVVDTILLSKPKQVRTDKLMNYRSLIPREIHHVKRRNINHIERNNLTLRTHLKRLNRRTICFSKSISMLSACLTIYFWG